MFDILVYLFEHYDNLSNQPDEESLTRTLEEAGFEQEDILEAVGWLQGLQQDRLWDSGLASSPRSIRLYSHPELAKLGSEGLGFLRFLEDSAVVTPGLRELIIERAMALPEDPLPLSTLKVIVLMVLWSREQELDSLLVEALLTEEGSLPH